MDQKQAQRSLLTKINNPAWSDWVNPSQSDAPSYSTLGFFDTWEANFPCQIIACDVPQMIYFLPLRKKVNNHLRSECQTIYSLLSICNNYIKYFFDKDPEADWEIIASFSQQEANHVSKKQRF